MPNLSNVANLVPKSTPHENMLCLAVMSIHDLQEAFRNMFGQATSVRDKQWLIRRMLFGLQNISEIGIMDASLVGRYDSKYQFVDSMLRGVVEEGDLHFRCNSDSICSGAGFAGRNIQLRPCLNNGSSIKSLSSECQTYITDRDLNLGEMPNLSNVANLIPKSTPDENLLCHDVMSIHELQEAFRNMFGQATSVRDKQWLIRRMLFGLQNISEIGNVSNLVDCGLSPFENEISLILSPETDLSEMMYSSCSNILDSRTCRFGYSCLEDVHAVEHDLPATFKDDRLVFGALKEQEGAFVTSKRLRKRTRRYIEEMSGMESRCSSERVESPSSSSDDRLLHVRKRSRYYRKRLTEMEVGSDYQMPCGLHTTFARNDCCKEDTQSMVVSKRVIATRPFESDSEDDLSDDSYTATKKEKSVDRRQQHKQWTIPEAMKLIEGVSQFGVGRWTAIKKRLFSTSSYRTPVDLKDKWRNLLRASGAQLHGRKKVRPQKQMTVPLPQTALQRIRELAIIHPYPRPKKNAHLCAAASNNGSRNSTSIRRHAATVR